MDSNKVSSDLVSKIVSIASNNELQKFAHKHELNINQITWEDTGRSKGSCMGPNITDMTLRLDKDGALLPVIRRPNFSDETADLSIEQFELPVGNENGKDITKIPLRKFLEKPKDFIKTDGKLESLFDEKRDKEILVSAQYCVLPLYEGTCEFNVHMYNYQSSSTEPAVLVLVVSSQGTSAQVLNGNSPLYFNDNGRACNFKAERMKDVRKREDKSEAMEMTAEEKEKNCLYIYQVPLKIKETRRELYSMCSTTSYTNSYPDSYSLRSLKYEERGMDDAILQKGESHSDFLGVNNKDLERDFQFPIRCTLQFYKVTDSVDITESVFEDMNTKIKDVYTKGINQGSLVTNGFTGRSTEWVDKSK